MRVLGDNNIFASNNKKAAKKETFVGLPLIIYFFFTIYFKVVVVLLFCYMYILLGAYIGYLLKKLTNKSNLRNYVKLLVYFSFFC